MFKRLGLMALVGVIALLTVQKASAQVYVSGYFRSNGTYVAPHFRSNPDGNFYNNWSTYPNINPYTGQMGTRLTPSYPSYASHSSRYETFSLPSYSSGGSQSFYPRYSSPSYRSWR